MLGVHKWNLVRLDRLDFAPINSGTSWNELATSICLFFDMYVSAENFIRQTPEVAEKG